MATIKLQLSGKVVIKDGKVSCGCCGACSIVAGMVDAGVFNGFSVGWISDYVNFGISSLVFNNHVFTCVNFCSVVNVESFQIETHRPARACIRVACRSVAVENGEIKSESTVFYFGPTLNTKILWTDICKPCWGDETESGLYLYVVDFRGWRARRNFAGGGLHSPKFIPTDENYDAYKFKLN